MKKSGSYVALLSIALSIVLAWMAMSTLAVEDTLNGKIYQLADGSEYAYSASHEVSSFVYGKNALGSPKLSGAIDQKTTYNGYPAFSISGSLTFGYSYNGSYQTDNKDAWNISSDSAKSVNGIKLSKKIKSGVIIVQRSQYGTDWENVQDPITDFFANNQNGNNSIFTLSPDENKNGYYYRVIVAYEMTRRTEHNVILGFINNDKYEYKECLEVYEFYVESNKNYVSFFDMTTRNKLNSNSTTKDGFCINKNGSTDVVKVSRDGGVPTYAGNYDYYSLPGEYTIDVTTNLGKKHTYTITVSQGLALTEMTPYVYESKRDKGFPMDNLVTGNTVFGKASLTKLYLARTSGANFTADRKNGYAAYGVTGESLSIFIKLNASSGDIGNGWTIRYDDWGKKEKETINGIHTGEIGKGAIVIQTSADGSNWTNADMGKYAQGLYTTDFASYYDTNEHVLVYTPSGQDIINGVYVRIIYAYEVYNNNGWKYQDYAEKYEFYLCSSELNAVTIHNLSVSGVIEDVLGDEDETVINLYKSAETMQSGDCTTTGFTVDTSMNPTVNFTVKRDGMPQDIPANGEFIVSGKYTILFASAVGDKREVVIYVDRNNTESVLRTYFGAGFLQGKRIYSEGTYPVYEANKVSYNLSAIDTRYLPLAGTITNQTTGTTIDIAHTRTAKTGVLAEPGQYIARFVTNPAYDQDGTSGDTRQVLFYFSIIAEGTAPGPVVNQQNLAAYCKTNVSDSYPMYYGLTYRSAGKGNITIAFATREAALEYAYNYEKGMVEKQEDGSFRYTGSLNVTQKEEYDSAWDLTDAMYYFAEQAIEVLYFDVSDLFTYLTLSEDVLAQVTNLRTLELDRSVTIFAEGQKEALCSGGGLPIISKKPYAYLAPGINGAVTFGYFDFEFIKDKYECDSSTVVIIDCDGVEYPIEYNKGVGAQLLDAGCATGIVTIVESTIYGDTATYQAVYIAEGDNTASLSLEYYLSGEKKVDVFTQKHHENSITVDAFRIASLLDKLDPYTLVTITGPTGKYFYIADQIPKDAWATPGEYTVAVTNRLGFEYIIHVTVSDAGYGTIEFSGSGTDELVTIITKYGDEKVLLPTLTQYGYDLVGFTDENGTVYSNEIAVIMFKGAKVLNAVWKAKEFKLSYVDEKGAEVLPSTIVTFGEKYALPSSVDNGLTLQGWKLNGELFTDQEILIDEEGDIVLVAVLGGSAETLPDDDGDVSTDAPTYGWVWIVIAITIFVIGSVVLYFTFKKKTDRNSDESDADNGAEEGVVEQ